jgi:hypothetical protein
MLLVIFSCKIRVIRGKLDAEAEVAQLVEQLIRNQQVGGSNPLLGSSFSDK